MEERQPEPLPYKQNAIVRVLDENRRRVRANAFDQFNKRCPTGRPGIERCWQERNFWRRKNCKPVERKIDMNEIDNCGCKDLSRRCRDGTKNLTTFDSGGVRVGV